jgi:hypothetical protein
MRFTLKVAITFVFVCLMGNAIAGGNKGKKVSISFHIETEESDNPKMIFPQQIMGQQRFFRRIPELSSKDYVAFSPFPSEDQASYGVVLQLKDHARRRLATITQISSGKWLVCQAFGQLVDAVMIEKPVDDGVIVIWSGLSIEQIQMMDESLPRIGQKKK